MADAEMNRRSFVSMTAATIATAAAACACGGACGMSDAFAAETAGDVGAGNAPGGPKPPVSTASKVDAGPVSQYDKDHVWDTFAKSNRVLIIREGDKIFAPSATCTHKNAVVVFKTATQQLTCLGHGSKFDNEGKPKSGPAKAPLLRHAVSIDANQHLIVDKTKTFGEKEWGNEAAFVKASA